MTKARDEKYEELTEAVQAEIEAGRPAVFRLAEIEAERNAAKAPMGTLNHDDMGHGKLSMSNQKNAIGKATGVIRSVGNQGDFLTIAHGPFEGGIKMDAMTMGFNIMGSVDLSSFAEGERVAFMVKQGRDGSYRDLQYEHKRRRLS